MLAVFLGPLPPSHSSSSVLIGSVLEFHLYTWQGGDISDDEVWPYIKQTVCQYILPEICARNFTLLGGYVQSNEVGWATSCCRWIDW